MKIVIIADLSSVKSDLKGQNYLKRTYSIFLENYSDVFVVCPHDALNEVTKIAPQDKIIVEPISRGTASAIGLAAAYLANQNPKELITFIFANQHINHQDRLINTLRVSHNLYQHLKRMMLIGVAITEETSDYGYIKIGKVIQEMSGIIAFEMLDFQRNPAQSQIKSYTQNWQYLWDTGCMQASAENILEIYQEALPEHFIGLMTIKAALGTNFEQKILNTVYKSFPKNSISKGIYEKIAKDKVCIVPVDLGINKYLN